MTHRRCRFLVAAACLALTAAPGRRRARNRTPRRIRRRIRGPASSSARNRSSAVAPARVVLTAELVGGANDFEEYYCPTISWDWGDDTTSESTVDCEPYEAGKSEIKRRFTVEHVFREEGSQKVFFRLKRHNKEVGAAWVTVAVRPGASPFE